MADRRQIGVHYCGDYNPQYDRAALIKHTGDFFPEAEFVTAQARVKYPTMLVVCGYPSHCANVSDLAIPVGRLIYLDGWEGLLPAKKKLAEALKEQQARNLTHKEVLDTLPHREPMLFIDTVGRLAPGEEAVTSFRARLELPCFADHFPGAPVLLGVYTTEVATRAVNILMMTTEHYTRALPLFMEVREATFRRKTLPGNTLEIRVSLLKGRAERVIAACRGQMFVEGMLTVDLELRLVFR